MECSRPSGGPFRCFWLAHGRLCLTLHCSAWWLRFWPHCAWQWEPGHGLARLGPVTLSWR